METPAIITQASIIATSAQPLTDTVFTFELTTINEIPSEGAFVITYPTSVQPHTNFKDCSVSVNQVSYRRSCTLNSDARTV